MKKKVLAFVLVAVVMVASGLAGCKEKTSPEHPSHTEEHPSAEHPK